MRIACLLKRLRRVFPDATYITIDSEYWSHRDGRIEVTYALHIKLPSGEYIHRQRNRLKEIKTIAEHILQLVEDSKIRDDKVLTANQVFRAFALSSPASIVKVEG